MKATNSLFINPSARITIVIALFCFLGCGAESVDDTTTILPQRAPSTVQSNSAPAKSPAPTAAPVIAAPEIPQGVAYLPRFFTEYGDAVGGMCCIVKLDAQTPPVLLTARSLIGPSGGLRFDIATTDQSNRIRDIELLDPGSKKLITKIKSDPLITLPTELTSFGTMGTLQNCGDIAAFRLPTSFSQGLQCATKLVAPKDVVWIVGRVAGDDSSTQLHEAIVDGLPSHRSRTPTGGSHYQPGDSYDFISFKLKNPTQKFQGLLGAAVVNSAGEVISILNNSSVSRDGGMIAYSVPIERFRSEVLAALEREKPDEVATLGKYSFTLPSDYSFVSQNEAKTQAVWSTSDPQLGQATIEFRLAPNKRSDKITQQAIGSFLGSMVRTLAKGQDHINPGKGEAIELPGLIAAKGDYLLAAGPIIDPFGREASQSGLMLVGANPDDLVLLLFRSNTVTRGSWARTLAEKSFNTLSTKDAAPTATNVSKKIVRVVTTDVQEAHRDLALRALVDLLSREEATTLSVNATGDDLEITYSTDMAIDQVAERIHMGSRPIIDRNASKISVQAIGGDHKNTANQKNPQQELISLVEILETRNALLDPVAALEKLIKLPMPDSASSEFKKRVATAMASALFDEQPVEIFEDAVAMDRIVYWDKDVARKSFSEFVIRGQDEMMMRTLAFEALDPIADESVVPQVVEALAVDESGHSGEPAARILSRYPDLAEPLVLDLFNKDKFADSLQRLTAIELLGEIGGLQSLKLLKEMQASDVEDYVLKRVNRSIPQIEKRLAQKKAVIE